MKQEELVMKTGNTFKKAAALLAAMGLTLALLVHTAGAQGSGMGSGEGEGKSRKSSEQVSYATQSATSYAAQMAARKASYRKFDLVDIVDEPMQLERWMVDKRYFVDRKGAAQVTEKSGTEKGEESSNMNSKEISELLIPLSDEPLKLEAWMTDGCNFPCDRKKQDILHELVGFAGK